jgi:dienelactone hydrolase
MLEKQICLLLRWLGKSLSRNKPAIPQEEWEEILAPHIKRYVPSHADKAPVILLMHGCAGDFSHLHKWAGFLAEQGFLAYTVDSLTPRGISSGMAKCIVCTGLRLHGGERSRDISAALSIIGKDPQADLDKLVFLGWSHGAWTIMEWLLQAEFYKAFKASGRKIAASIFIYPYCGLASAIHLHAWPHDFPVFFVTAQQDRVVPNKRTMNFYNNLLKVRGCSLTHTEIEGVAHGFDLFERKNLYNEAKARELQALVVDYLKQTTSR